MEFLKEAATLAGSLSSIIGVLTLILWKPILKPMREKRKKAAADEKQFKEKVTGALGAITDRLDAMESAADEDEKDRIRYEVLDFANSCRNKRKHTEDEFRHIVTIKDKYDTLLKKTGDTNGVFTMEYEYILEIYKQCQREDSFL